MLALLSAAAAAPATFATCPDAPQSLPAGLDPAMDAVVVITTESGTGSGFFVSKDGVILTAAHVVADAREVKVKTRSGQELAATTVRVRPTQDVAVLKVDTTDARCLQLGAAPKVGAEAFVIGSPAGLEYSVSRGIVSGTPEMDGLRLLQTDASVNPGNSGGPILDAEGRAVAVVSFKVAAKGFEGLGFGVAQGDALTALELSAGDVTALPEPEGTGARSPEEQAVWDRGFAAGTAAAGEGRVGAGPAVIGGLSGCVLGPLGCVGASAAYAFGAAPVAAPEVPGDDDAIYTAGYVQGYQSAMQRRRATTACIGGTAGTVLAFGVVGGLFAAGAVALF